MLFRGNTPSAPGDKPAGFLHVVSMQLKTQPPGLFEKLFLVLRSLIRMAVAPKCARLKVDPKNTKKTPKSET